MASGTIRILDPVGAAREVEEGPAQRLRSVGGQGVGFISNGWRSWDVVVERYAELAVQKYEAREALSRKNPNASSGTPKDTMDELAARVEAVVVGIGH